MRVLARIAVVFLFLLTVSTTVFGQEFHILNLTQSLGLPFGSGVSLNDQDVIATLVHIGNTGEIVTVDISRNFTNLTQGQFNFPGQASINNLGQIVFTVDAKPPDDCSIVNCNVIFWNGSSFQNITNGSIPVYPAGVLGRALNDSGLVAIGTAEGLALYNGVNLTMLTSGTSITDTGNQPPSINSSGQIAFLGIDFTINRTDMYLFDSSSIINLTKDSALQIVDVNGYPSINDSGHVAFLGVTFGEPNVPNGRLFFYNGTEIIDLTATLGIPHNVEVVSLNNSDQIAFITRPGSGPGALWFFDLNTGIAKQIDSDLEVSTVQINNHGNIAYIKDQNLMLATLTSQDVTPPAITITATPDTLWPPNGKLVPVTVSGTITDAGSGVDANRVTYAVKDEYRLVQPRGPITLGGNGSYSFRILLQASRKGNDKDGRQYIVTISALDNAGNQGSEATGVTVPHDQGHR